MIEVRLREGEKIYFASDNHLGAPTNESSMTREKKFVRWLDQVKKDAGAIFLLGDLFDFWFEYKKVVPKGFVRVLGKLAQLRDSGIDIYFFVGNHDLWMGDYFERELNIRTFREVVEVRCEDKLFLIGHGDGLGPHDKGYKRMKKIFTNKACKWLFRWIHPDLGVALAQYLSIRSKLISGAEDVKFLGEDKEWLVAYCKRKQKTKHYDYFLFGHRHLPMEIDLGQGATYINTGDWINYYSYAVFEKGKCKLEYYTE